MLDYFNSHDYCRKSDLLRGKLDPSLRFWDLEPRFHQFVPPWDWRLSLTHFAVPIFADLCMTDQMQIWKWTSTPASVLLCIVRSTYAAVSRPTISSSSVSSLREMAEKYSIIWASVICGAHNFLCLLPLWDRALQRWRMSSWYFSATLTMGTMTMLVTAPQLHRQWGHCGTILGYHSKFSGSQDCHLRLHQSWWLPLFIKQGVPK